MKSPAPNSAGLVTTRCTAWSTLSARKILTSGWLHGRQRNSNGDRGYGSFARSSRVYPEIHFQPRPQGNRTAVLLPGAHSRIHWDAAVCADAFSHDLADCHPTSFRRDQTGDLPCAHDDARHDHGVLRAHDSAAGRLRQLRSANPDWRAGHGVPGAEHAVVLDNVRRVHHHYRGILRIGWRTAARLDRIRTAQRIAVGGTGSGAWRGSLDHQHRDFLYRVADGCSELHYDNARPAGQGHDADAHASDGMVVVHNRHPGFARVRRIAVGGNSAVDGSESRNEFLRSAGCGKRTGDGSQGRITVAVAAPVLVLRTSGGIHRDPAWHGSGIADSVDVLA